jgi:hypothetical protein
MRALSVGFGLCLLTAVAVAQAPPPKPAAPAAAQKPATSKGPSGTLAQVMRGMLFGNSNIIFDVQTKDPGAPPKKEAGSGVGATTSETFANIYTGWQTVENAAIALEEAADVILKPGRMCEGGKPVPLNQANYRKWAANLKDVAQKTLAAAKEKNQEKVSDIANDLSDACLMCHEVYRDTGPPGSPLRCVPPAAAKK